MRESPQQLIQNYCRGVALIIITTNRQMIRDKPLRTSLRATHKQPDLLRSSIDCLPSQHKNLRGEGCPFSLSESYNFGEKITIVDRPFRKPKPIVNTTSALFEQNASPNVIKIVDTQICQNHDSKGAQFKVVTEGDVMYYCERCAISLASQGFNVCKIDSDYGKGASQPIELEFLLDHLDLLRDSLQKKLSNLRKQSSISKGVFDKAQDSIQAFYHQISNIVEQSKKQALSHLEDIKSQFHRQYPCNQQKIEKKLSQLSTIKSQIKKQVPEIQSSRSSDYRMRLSNYKTKLQTHRSFLSQIGYCEKQLIVHIPHLPQTTESLRHLIEIKFGSQPGKQQFSFSKSFKSKEISRPISQFSGNSL